MRSIRFLGQAQLFTSLIATAISFIPNNWTRARTFPFLASSVIKKLSLVFFTLTSTITCSAFTTQQYTLDNGLKILVKEDHRSPAAVSMLWYNIGSADEPSGITGISHILEHMMFKGTKEYPLGIFSKTIAELGGQENAMTNNDYTVFYEKIAAKDLPTALTLEADRMNHLSFTETDFTKEMSVIQEERRLRVDDNPQSLTFERFLATAHLSEPYHHPVIGWMSDLKQMKLKDIQQWYQQYYQPNNAILVVVGDVNPKSVFKLAKNKFGNLTKHNIPERKALREPRPLGLKKVEVQAYAQVPMLMIGYTVPTVTTAIQPKDPYTLELIAGILSAGESSILMTNLVREKQIASSIDIFYNLYARYQTQFIIYGTPSKKHTTEDMKYQILNEIQKIKVNAIPNSNLDRVKTQIIAQKTFEKDSIFGQAMEIGLLATIGADEQTAEQYIARINAITAADIQEAAKRYFTDNNMTIGTLIPSSH